MSYINYTSVQARTDVCASNRKNICKIFGVYLLKSFLKKLVLDFDNGLKTKKSPMIKQIYQKAPYCLKTYNPTPPDLN